jgi:RHS repeat-associated protein
VYFLHDDRLGTPQLATDVNQTIQWTASYQPFGATNTGIGLIVQDLRLPGQEYDSVTGWNHNGFREYVPGLGRYVESDPIGLSGGINAYAYVGGNPLNRIDPLGLRDYSDAETQQEFLCPAFRSATAGPIAGLWNIFNNSRYFYEYIGPYDFGHNAHQHDTFNVDGYELTASQFGNYIAGYEGEAYDEKFGHSYFALHAVYLGGKFYHQNGGSGAKNDPQDLTGLPDILAGAFGAAGAWLDSSNSGCGCKQ